MPGAVAPGAVLGSDRDELLALANGRRTPRDLAFALGRGVYATTLELGRMQHEGLLVTTSVRAAQAAAPPLQRRLRLTRHIQTGPMRNREGRW
ncbi:MAG TPA: hypothetical protein VGI00_13595 [Streptosporangiaceae bacterium]